MLDNTETQTFPWDNLERVALLMGIGVEEFWALTPGEVLRVLSQPLTANINPLNQAELQNLMTQFPDKIEKSK